MNDKLDPRIHAYRDDLADIRLQEHVEARRFVSGTPGKIIAPIASLYGAADASTSVTTQGLMGETLQIFETKNGFHWVQLDADNYVGYVAAHEVDHGEVSHNHEITAPLTHVYAKADIKSQPLELLPMGARFHAMGSSGDEFLSLTRGGFIKTTATKPKKYSDLAAAAAKFLHAPYLWGGRSALGIDCSGLVQMAIKMVGQISPRDSDQQSEIIGTEISDATPLMRNDLIFFKGHVGIMWNETDMIHANASTMNVAIEPLADVKKRTQIIRRRRLTG